MHLTTVIGLVFIVGGTALTFVTALGLVRFHDLYSRMHAATKPPVLGLLFNAVGLTFILGQLSVALTLFLVVIFQMITSPISAHILGRKAYRSDSVTAADLVVDEYTEDLREAERNTQTLRHT